MDTGNKPSWQQAFSDLIYWKWQGLPSAPSVQSAVGFMEQALQLTEGARVLDLGSALGYHSLELARRGYEVTGLEWSPAFLEKARQAAAEARLRVNFVRGDMTRLEFAAEFDAVVLWGNTFGIFSEEENFQTLVGLRRALKPGGKALIDTENYSGLNLSRGRDKDWFFRNEEPDLLFLTQDTSDLAQARLGYDVIALDLASGRRHTLSFSWRLYLLPELKRLLQAAGLELLGVYGDDPMKTDWNSYESGAPYPYAVEGFNENSARRILFCQGG